MPIALRAIGAGPASHLLPWFGCTRHCAGLQLTRPLVTLDLEATGAKPERHRIVEIAAVKLMPDGSIVTKGPQRINPGVHIADWVAQVRAGS